MLPNVYQQFDELRKQKVFDFKETHALTVGLKRLIAGICDEYTSGPDEERVEIRALVVFEISFLFFMFSHEMAEEAVQKRSQAYLIQSLVALLIENCTFDSRDSMIALSKVFHSAQRLGMPAEEMVISAADISSSTMLHLLRTFAAREPRERDIHAFGFAEGKNADGLFAYVSTARQVIKP